MPDPQNPPASSLPALTPPQGAPTLGASGAPVITPKSLPFGSSLPQAIPDSFDLRSIPLFETLRDSDLAALQRASAPVTFPAHTNLTPGSFKGNVLVLISGEVESLLSDAAGKTFPLGVQSKGFAHGALSILGPDHAKDKKVTLRALTEVQALVIPHQVFSDIVFLNPGALLELARQLAVLVRSTTNFARTAVDVTLDPTQVQPDTLADIAAGKLTRGVGSWRFVGGSLLFISVWMGINSIPSLSSIHIDKPPFVGLNTLFSLLSAFTGSIILISQNFREKLDRSVIAVIQRVTLGIAAKVEQMLKAQTRTHRRLEILETQLMKLGANQPPNDSSPPSPLKRNDLH